MRKARSQGEKYEVCEVNILNANLMDIDIDDIIDDVEEGTHYEKAEETIEKWKKEQMEKQQKLEKARARAKEHYSKCILKLWKDSPFGIIIKPDGEEGYWEEFCNIGYYSFFGDTPKEEIFKKVIYSKEAKPD